MAAVAVFGMALAAGVAPGRSGEDSVLAETRPQAELGPGEPSSGDPQAGDRVVTAQRGEQRDMKLQPVPQKDSTLYLPNIADIAERANEAVVNIRAIEIIRAGSGRRRAPSDPFEFFMPRPDRPPRGDDQGDDDRREDSGGSGFIVTDDGFVMTNYHVIEEADKIVIRLEDDNHEYEAKVVGTDRLTDLALLKIDAGRKLPTIPLGDSDALRVGEWVIAIGNPLIYDHTVTVGVVSAKGRKLAGLSNDVALDNYIQTDAAINRGNSGGPLLNVKGEAVGINSAISVAGQGISFAIPVNMARDVMTQLRATGKVMRGFLGVTIQDIQTELRASDRAYWGLEGRRGAFIQSVTDDQPAARAGVRPGDAIIKVDGQEIAGSDDLIRTISAKPPGATVSLGVVREGKERTLKAELTNRPDPVGRASRQIPEVVPDEPATDRRLGITVEDISPEARREFTIDPAVKGVIVAHVSEVSEAWDRGLREGDVITEVNRHPIASLTDYRALVEQLRPGDKLALYVTTPGVEMSRFVILRVGDE